MPQLLTPIEQIAQEKRRGVLYITFYPRHNSSNFEAMTEQELDEEAFWYWGDCPKRKKVIEWLDKNLIAWTECDTSRYQGPILYLTYEGSIYIDIPYDLKNETYLKIQDYLEKSDGKMKDPDVILWYLPLERALPNLRN
ncbi:hypothetical protein [Advenella alkanexedens]|mgnify:FL=1|uniref:hypothetical protein n=1 Tax=Advenella alkanexedens TaxID=1481665 RepID=UPI002675829B|nr:hypothetical protein [Advenella alkanexedens]WKU20118.1 hypothetical protein Q3V95_03500 [Advenella alkanexedens]